MSFCGATKGKQIDKHLYTEISAGGNLYNGNQHKKINILGCKNHSVNTHKEQHMKNILSFIHCSTEMHIVSENFAPWPVDEVRGVVDGNKDTRNGQ